MQCNSLYPHASACMETKSSARVELIVCLKSLLHGQALNPWTICWFYYRLERERERREKGKKKKRKKTRRSKKMYGINAATWNRNMSACVGIGIRYVIYNNYFIVIRLMRRIFWWFVSNYNISFFHRSMYYNFLTCKENTYEFVYENVLNL